MKTNKMFSSSLVRQRGFTLVEISIVLVIIGLILGAVSIGRDLQRDAEYSKIKQKFIDQWVQAYNSHYQRSGVVVGDEQTEPRLMVNGKKYSGVLGGDMGNVEGPGELCQTTKDTQDELHSYLDRLGIRMPAGRAEGMEDRYAYLDSNGNPQEIQICFQWNNPDTGSGSGNVMVVKGLTPDLARTLDQMIDGKPDAIEGMFRQADITATTSQEWSDDNEGTDEAQVPVVIAHYKMNQ